MTFPFFLDLLGTFVFGLSGAVLAVRRELDLVGVATLAVVTALAGGMMRDVLLGATPPASLRNPVYLWIALGAAACGFFLHRWIEVVSKPVMLIDAMGLGLFAVTGCRKALSMGLDPLPAILLGTLSAVGGGVVRDVLITETPRVLREEIYALAALLGAALVAAGEALEMSRPLVSVAAVVFTFALRVGSMRKARQAPRAPGGRQDR